MTVDRRALGASEENAEGRRDLLAALVCASAPSDEREGIDQTVRLIDQEVMAIFTSSS